MRVRVLRSLSVAILMALPARSGSDGLEASRKYSATITVSAPREKTSVSVSVNSDLVQIPVTVVNKADQVIEHLDKNVFEVYENGVPQTIAHFETGEAPISACLIFDASGSMRDKLHRAIEAVQELLNAAIPEDEYCLVRISSEPELMVRMSKGPEGVAAAMNRIFPGGFTALLDSIYSGMQEVTRGQNRRKAIILISDGGDNRSLHTRQEIKQLVREADAQIYSIGIITPDAFLVQPEEIIGPSLMENISNQSGGRLFRIHKVTDLPTSISKITVALRHQYVLGYYSKDAPHDGKYRRVTVKLNVPKTNPGLRAYWRAGYYAPNQ